MNKSNRRYFFPVFFNAQHKKNCNFFPKPLFFCPQWSLLSLPPHTSAHVRQIPAALPAMLPGLSARTKVWGFLAHAFGVSDTSWSPANPQWRLWICVYLPQANLFLLDSSVLTGALCHSLHHASWPNCLSCICYTRLYLCWKSPQGKNKWVGITVLFLLFFLRPDRFGTRNKQEKKKTCSTLNRTESC